MEPAVDDVVGYVVCVGCGNELVLDVVARRSGDLCLTCFVKAGEPRRAIEIEARGARISVPLGASRPRRKKHNPSPEAKAREKMVDKCKDRAMRRLRAVFPDLYDIFLAEERAAVGLDPWPMATVLKSGPDPDGSQTERFAALYHALQDRGVDA